MRIAVLTSTPLDPREGSGTFVALAGFEKGLEALGHTVEIRPLGRRTGFHTLDRWLYNVAVRRDPPLDADLVVGCDLDGFLWARRRGRRPFVVMLKGIIADKLKLTPQVATSRDAASMIAKIKTEHADGIVLIVGHSNTLPGLIKAFGGPDVKIADQEYDNLFVVVPQSGAMTRIRY